MRPNIRMLHRKIAPILFLLLAVSALTGLAYRVGKKCFGVDGQTGQAIMDVHAGGWLGSTGSTIYVLAIGLGLLGLLISGALLLRKGRAKAPARASHCILGAILLLPLAASAVTGILYKLGQGYLGFSEETSDLLMSIHEGAWLGSSLKMYYVLLIGSGLLALGLLGLRLLLPARRASAN